MCYEPFAYWLVEFIFFFFKQKTAYEMRISDWSSDVCSSDLLGHHRARAISHRRSFVHASPASLGARGLAVAAVAVATGAQQRWFTGPQSARQHSALEDARQPATQRAAAHHTAVAGRGLGWVIDRKSTRLNSSH